MTEHDPELAAAAEIRARIDTDKPHSARFWNYFVGGKDHYEVDREIGDHIKEIFPGLVDVARTSRHFLGRAVEHLAGEQGIRQFLDIGTGLPTADNTHEVAQRVAPDARIVYVDNDPWSSPTPVLCSRARPRARRRTSTPICTSPRPSSRQRRTRWTSPSPSP